MSSPDFELQVAIVARLKADAFVAAIVEDRVFDSVPEGAQFPYVSLGPTEELSDDVTAGGDGTATLKGFEITLQIDCWSRAVGSTEAKRLADTVRSALVGDQFALNENALVYFEHRVTRTFRDPDGLTSHAALTFEAFAEQP